MYSAMLMIRSESLYYRLSGVGAAGIMLLPVAIALVAYWRGGGFEPDTGLLNRDDAAEPHEEAPSPSGREETAGPAAAYQPLTRRMRWIGAAIFLAGLATLAIPVSRFGDSPEYKLSSARARASADAFLKSRGLDPSAFQQVTYPAAHWVDGDSMAAKYFLERRPVSAASALFERNRPVQHWATRYFKSLDQEEITVTVHPETGRVMGFVHTIPEDRAGADIPPERARELAMQFANQHGWDISAMDLKESASERKKARRDHSLEWEARAGDPRNVDEARWRVHIGISGDRVDAARGFWKLPETFERAREQENALAIVVTVAKIVVFAGLIVFGMWLLIQATRHGAVPWRRAIRLALPATVAFPVAALLNSGLIMKNYNTAVPVETFRAMAYVGIGMSALLGFVVMGAAAALICTFYPEAPGSLRAASRRIMGVDAATALLAATGIAVGLHQLQALLADRFHQYALFSIGSPDIIASAVPALAVVAGALRSLLTMAALAGVLVLLFQRTAKTWMRIAGVLVALCATLPGDIRTPGEFAVHYAVALVIAACAFGFFHFFGRRNYLAYALVLWLLALYQPTMQLLGNGNAYLEMHGWIVAAIMAASILWAVAPALANRQPRAS
jgi:hypothetical protein